MQLQHSMKPDLLPASRREISISLADLDQTIVTVSLIYWFYLRRSVLSFIPVTLFCSDINSRSPELAHPQHAAPIAIRTH